jgi:hypothetical protein
MRALENSNYRAAKSSGNSKYGAAKSPGLGQFPSSNFFCKNNICISPVLGSQYGAMTEAE